MTAILIIIALSEIAWAVWNYLKADEIAEKEEYLDKYAAHLDERANKLSADEEATKALYMELLDAMERQKAKEAGPINNAQASAEAKKKIAKNTQERYGVVLQAAEEATGRKLSNARTAEDTTIRAFVSYHMHNEGFSYESIGRVMHRNHSTITHLVRKMEDMLSLPEIYDREFEQYKKMCDLL